MKKKIVEDKEIIEFESDEELVQYIIEKMLEKLAMSEFEVAIDMTSGKGKMKMVKKA